MQIKAFKSMWNFEKEHATFKQIRYPTFLTVSFVVSATGPILAK